MDPDMQARVDADAAALERDVLLLEQEASKAGKSLARKLGPPLAVLLVLVVIAWILGRRSRALLTPRGSPVAGRFRARARRSSDGEAPRNERRAGQSAGCRDVRSAR